MFGGLPLDTRPLPADASEAVPRQTAAAVKTAKTRFLILPSSRSMPVAAILRLGGPRSQSGKLRERMKIVVGADDEGPVADTVVAELEARGHDVTVLDRDQWPEVARKVAETVASGDADQGVLFCWTGTGTSMAANKVPGVRAALAWDPWIAEGARRWNDANVLVMSLKRTTPEEAKEILDAWLAVEEADPDEAANIARLTELDEKRAGQ